MSMGHEMESSQRHKGTVPLALVTHGTGWFGGGTECVSLMVFLETLRKKTSARRCKGKLQVPRQDQGKHSVIQRLLIGTCIVIVGDSSAAEALHCNREADQEMRGSERLPCDSSPIREQA